MRALVRHLCQAALVAACLCAGAGATSASPLPAVVGTEFVLRAEDGSERRSRDLIGAVMQVQTGSLSIRVRIDAVEPDPRDASGEILLHTFSVEQADGSWRNLCKPGPDGRRAGFPLIVAGGVNLVCTAGAQAKCVRLGYKAWKTAADGTPLRDLYEACIRMIRADYCGDSVATTRDGTTIDIYDDTAIQTPSRDGSFEFEAGWSATGAVCVRHVRIPDNVSLARLHAQCPRLAAVSGEACTEEHARALGARLFNRSR